MEPNPYPDAVTRELRRLAVQWKRAAPADQPFPLA